MSIFFLAIPVGSALGYLTGGFVQSAWGWREAFYVGGVPGLGLAAICLLLVEPQRKLAAVKTAVSDAAAMLARIPLYRRAVLGYCAHTAAIGAFSYWGPTFLVRRFAEALSTDPSCDTALAPSPSSSASSPLHARRAQDRQLLVRHRDGGGRRDRHDPRWPLRRSRAARAAAGAAGRLAPPRRTGSPRTRS